jgi:hypothetical protein
MSDDKTKTGRADRDQISLSEDYEIRDWCKSLDCSETTLRNAVAQVGNRAANVRAYLQKQK